MSGAGLDDQVVNALIVAPAILGCIYSAVAWNKVSAVELNGHPSLNDPLMGSLSAKEKTEVVALMKKINKTIADGAMSFLTTEYMYMGAYVVVFSGILMFFTGWETTVAFVVGALTSIMCGWIGMSIAVFTNVRTTHEAWAGLDRGFNVAVQGGCVMGFSLVSLGVVCLFVLIKVLQATSPLEGQVLYEAVAGYGLGGSSIALFGRVGGGIYTKAADVGADLSGKNSYGMEEDDYRNPGCIADNVGDNVGDIAGMGADLFGSFAEATCAAMVLAASSPDLMKQGWCAMMYPMLISSVGILVGIFTILVYGMIYKINNADESTVEKALKGILNISTLFMTPVAWWLSKVCLPETFSIGGQDTSAMYCCLSIIMGLWAGLLIGYVTEYYTSSTYLPVREIAETQKQSAATGIIYGLALGYLSCIVPVLALGVTILIAHSLCGMFGIALSALGMLGTMTMALTIDAYGPISDNAGGIAEMAGLPEVVRARTDCLDAAGNTTAAIGKGFAIGSAALVSLALFGAFTVRAKISDVDILDPWVFTGLLFGAMMPYAFAAWTMKSVGMAANDMVVECMRQFKEMFENGNTTDYPDYHKCIQISTDASLREMIKPGLLVILAPLVTGLGFGKNACAGLLSGALVSSVQLAISMSNTGGAWDNSKKYITGGGLGKEFCKGSEAHKNSVTGDTVGDPLKDTSGPALNIVMKLTAILSLVFGSAIADYSNAQGGPFWMKT